MIDNIFLDLDETLVSAVPSFSANSDTLYPERTKFYLNSVYGQEAYLLKVRECSKNIIDFCRGMVGDNNVYILTAATRDYAERVNEIADFGFTTDKIFTREDMNDFLPDLSVNPEPVIHALGAPGNINVLIDNLPLIYNLQKITFMNINSTNYLEVDNYEGDDSFDESFTLAVKSFLASKYAK